MTPRVLIVDDSLTVRMDLAECLEAAGLSTFPCATAADARQALKDGTFGLVILDVVLPDQDGVDFLRALRGDPTTKRVPVMLLSTESEVRDRIRGLSTGADEYLGKPYDRGYLVSRARELLRVVDDDDAGSRPATVLVIDDSETFRAALRSALEAAGHVVLTAATGEAGLRTAAEMRPAVIIVDGVLPGIDGVTVIRRVRLDAAIRRTPCLLLTALNDASAEVRGLDDGADAWLVKGEDMTLVLARVAALLRSAGESPANTTVSLLGPKRILAVDDSPTYLHGLADALRAEGYEVALARSGEAALELLAVQPVDCVLLDLVMPGIGGNETCRRIKATPRMRDAPLIMLTAREDRAAMLEGLESGADDYIAKSSDFQVLRARVLAQIRRKHFEDENRRIREELVRREVEAVEARAARELAETRAALVEELEGRVRERTAELMRMEDVKLRSLELEADNARIQEANRLKSEFLANMSHELRTPLNAIIGFTQLLHDGEVTADMPEHHEFLGDILASGRHLLQLINDVLDLSKVEAGKLDFSPEPIDLPALLAEVLGILQASATAKRIAVRSDLDPALTDLVVDPGRLKQVLYNYASNALKFTPAGGRVTIRAYAQGDLVFRLEVEDTGIGIEASDLKRLFVEFQQLDAGLAKQHAGTGLGLALTRRLVEAQGGVVGATSTVGQGSIFHAILPRRPRQT
jgi:DNA-binding response OmpR family regulator